MKEFDVVKFTLVTCVLLIVLVGGAWLWLGWRLGQDQETLDQVERSVEQIGEISGRIAQLEEEMNADKLRSHPDAYSYFHEMGATVGIDSTVDYDMNTKNAKDHGRFRDEDWVLEFKSGREKSREQIFKFIYNVETQSPRFRLVKATLRLDSDEARRDLWRVQGLTFLRREPKVAVGQ